MRLLVGPPENKNCPVTFHACPLSQLQVRRRLEKLRQTLLKSQVSEPVDDAMAFSWLSKGWKEGASATVQLNEEGPVGIATMHGGCLLERMTHSRWKVRGSQLPTHVSG